MSGTLATRCMPNVKMVTWFYNGGNAMIKEMLLAINHAMFNDEMSIFCAKQLLKSLSVLTGKRYYIFKKRVVYKENDQVFDAWANA